MQRAVQVLVVEDEPTLRYFITAILTLEGISVLGLPDGCKAIEYLEQVFSTLSTPPRLILLDWVMPCMDGDLVYRKIGLDPRLKNTAIVIASAAREAIKFPEGYPTLLVLDKPYDMSDLIKTVRDIAPDIFEPMK